MQVIDSMVRSAVVEYLGGSATEVDKYKSVYLFRMDSAPTTCVLATAKPDAEVVALQVFSSGKLARTADMKYTNRRGWKHVNHVAAKQEVLLKDLIPLAKHAIYKEVPVENTDPNTPKGRTNSRWTEEEYQQITEMFATLVHGGKSPDLIDYDMIVEEFGEVLDRNAGDINSRLSFLSAVTKGRGGKLHPTMFDHHQDTVEYVRDLLRDLDVEVWEGEWTCIRPKKKVSVTMENIQEKVPSLTKLGKRVSMSVEDLEKLLLELQK